MDPDQPSPAARPCHAFLIFAGTGPILLLSAYPEASDPHLAKTLAAKGIGKYIAYEVALDVVRARYQESFETVARELGTVEDIRVLDFNGHQIMANFSLRELGEPLKVGD